MLEKTGILKLEGCIKNKINRIFLTQLLYQQKKIKVLGLILNMSLFLLAQHSKEIA
jgi:hypothetical protein